MHNDFQLVWLLDQMAQHRMLFHIVVAQMNACRTLLNRPGASAPPESEVHKNLAISTLQKELANPANGIPDAMLATKAYLSIYEVYFGDPLLSVSHRQDVGRLVALRGGTRTLPAGSAIRTLVMM